MTTFNDNGGIQSTVSYSNWDSMGHFQVETESGDDIGVPRTTRTKYTSFDPDVYDYREVSDGLQVVSRTDNHYAGFLVDHSIARLILPGTIATATASPLVAQVGDIKTDYIYDANLNLVEKKITDQGDSGSTQFQMDYTWQGGGYLATKQFAVRGTSTFYTWKAIDRDRDPNTGLIFAVRDSAGIRTDYRYDALGRLYDILPSTTEFPTQVEYVDVWHTTVRQGDATVMGTNVNCANSTADFIMSCYESRPRRIRSAGPARSRWRTTR